MKPVKGLSWGQAAVGNATWTGVLLRDVLLAAGLREDTPGIEHVQVCNAQCTKCLKRSVSWGYNCIAIYLPSGRVMLLYSHRRNY